MKRVFSSLLILATLLFFPATSVHAATVCNNVSTNLNAFYELEEGSGVTKTDSQASYDLSDINGIPTTTGKIGSAALFTRANSEKANRADVSGTTVGGNITMAGWTNITNAPTSGQLYTLASVAGGGTSPYVAYILYYQNEGGTLKLNFNRQRMAVANADFQVTQTLTPGTWYHVGATYDGTNVKIYLDGAEIGSSARSGNGAAHGGANETVLGALHASQGNFADAALDEWGIWASALTTELATLTNSGSGISFPCAAVISNAAPAQLYFRNADLYVKNGSLYKK